MEGFPLSFAQNVPNPELLTTQSGVFDSSKLGDHRVIEATLKYDQGSATKVSLSGADLPTSLAVTTQEIIDRLNELLIEKVPEGIQSLKPEQHTPEATADRIVQGATAFFDIFAQQNPDLEGEELVTAFMETIRSGIDEGYEDAFNILEGLGAFQIDGVQDGIEATRELINQKLLAYEEQKRAELGLEPIGIEERVVELTNSEAFTQVGTQFIDTVA